MSLDRAGRGASTPVAFRLTCDHPHWPPLWRPIYGPPPGVHACGDTSVLRLPCLGIVGTRQASPRGLAVARGLAAGLAASGWVVVSGLARGIDAAAHRGALEVKGCTVAVMATGNDICYPPAHRALLAQIRAQGCSLTEFPDGTPPLKHHFPRRNRLLAGLVQGLVVVEAPERSGALLTAREALDEGREVFAVPGPVDLLTSRGCHRLLKEGAHLVESVTDVLDVLGAPRPAVDGNPREGAVPEPAAGSSARWLYDRLDLEGIGRDTLRCQWPGDERSWVEGLTTLEMAGLIHRLPGGRLARKLWSG